MCVHKASHPPLREYKSRKWHLMRELEVFAFTVKKKKVINLIFVGSGLLGTVSVTGFQINIHVVAVNCVLVRVYQV